MKLKRSFVFFLLVFATRMAVGQEISFADTIKSYNTQRILTNAAGKEVLGGWGLANIAAGGIGYFSAKQDEWKYFHEMNAAFGLVNTATAARGLIHARKQAVEKLNFKKAYQDYRADKRKLLYNIGFDVVCSATGALLAQSASGSPTDQAMYKGFGRSLVLQGVFLLATDNIVFLAHQRLNSRWLTIVDELRFTGNGISYNHNFQYLYRSSKR